MFLEKISVSVRIPAIGRTYEFIVPSNMSVRNIQYLMLKILSSEYGISNQSSDIMLFDTKDHMALRLECNFEQLQIFDGAELLLI